tara:strand:- start:185 stop:433 length:249 start_codon:yes stop_codon:yes gene_type:complete
MSSFSAYSRNLETISLALSRMSNIVNMLPELANKCDISSGELYQYLVEKIGENLLSNTIDIEEIATNFGTSEAANWKKLLDM